MAKMKVKVGGQTINMNTDNPKVADALANLIQACAERQFGIGTELEHVNGNVYLLARIKSCGGFRAYLINTATGRARNSRKVMWVKTDDPENFPNGYVTDLPEETDKFFDPDGSGELLDIR